MVNFVLFRKYKQLNMDKMPLVNKNWKSDAECYKDYIQKKKLNDAISEENERKRFNAYRTKKKKKSIWGKKKLLSMKKNN